MSMTMERKPARRPDVESQPLPDGSGLLFDPVTATAYPITASAMRIWELCDAGNTVAAIVDDLEAHYEVDRETVERDTLALLADFGSKGLLAELSGSE